MTTFAPSKAQYVALCVAFAGRFQQLFNETRSEADRKYYLRAAAFALDRTTPDPEIHVKVLQGQVKDPVKFMCTRGRRPDAAGKLAQAPFSTAKHRPRDPPRCAGPRPSGRRTRLEAR